MEDLVILKIETSCNTSDKKLLENLRYFKDAQLQPPDFNFSEPKNRPLMICGSGPSLKRYFPVAHKIFNNCDVMALNGAYNALQDMGCVPDYYIQLDARPENVNFVSRPHKDTQFLLSSQCHPDILEALKGFDVRMYHLNTPTTRRVFEDAPIYFGGGATVGTTAMGIAAALGYRVLGIFGFDSSYDGDMSHVIPQPQNENQKTLDVWIHDRKYISTAAMAKQVEEFRPWCATLEKTFPGIDIRLFGDGLLYDYIMSGQSADATRESEAAKYAEMYKDPSYRMPKHRMDAIIDILSAVPRGRLLDIGTGRGETLEIAQGLGFSPVTGTETVDYLIENNENVTYGLLPNISIPSKYYDTVTCFEVIEHLLPCDVVPALREMERLAKDRVIISAATRSDIRHGVELHPSWRTQYEWEQTFKSAWGANADVRYLGNLSSCGLSPVYEYRLYPETK